MGEGKNRLVFLGWRESLLIMIAKNIVVVLIIIITKTTMSPQHLKSTGFRNGCWHPEHEELADSYIEFEGAVRYMNVKSLLSMNFGRKCP